MPKIDGLGILKALKKDPPQTKNGPIVLLTNMAHNQVIDEGLKLGAKTYLIKSDLNPEVLAKKVKEILSH